MSLMDDQPLVSVIIPTYNRANLVSDAIKSVLRQTYKKFELIIVDDHSSDNTAQVVGNINDSRIRYFCHSENLGGSAARNTGIDKSQSELIAFLDSDDIWFPQKLERQLNTIDDSNINQLSLVYCGKVSINIDNSGKVRRSTPKEKGLIHKDLLYRNVIGSLSGVLVKKAPLLEVGGFQESLKSEQDWDFYLRISKQYKVDYTDSILYLKRNHNNNITSNLKLKFQNFYEYKPTLYNFIDECETCKIYDKLKAKSLYSFRMGRKICEATSLREEFVLSLKAFLLLLKSFFLFPFSYYPIFTLPTIFLSERSTEKYFCLFSSIKQKSLNLFLIVKQIMFKSD